MQQRWKKWIGFVILLGTIPGLQSCDPEGKKDCVWVLEPEPRNKGKVEAGFIPVCARNRQKMKQDCRLQITLPLAKKYYGKKFRYDDMEVASPALPRTIQQIRFCE